VFLNGNRSRRDQQQFSATASGSYTVTVTTSGCTSAASSATVVTVNPIRYTDDQRTAASAPAAARR